MEKDFESKNNISPEFFENLIKEKNFKAIKETLSSINEMDAAELVSSLDEEKIVPVFRLLPKDVAADIFANFDSDVKMYIIMKMTDKESAAIIEEQMVDDAVDTLEELPANVVKKILANVSTDMRKKINQFLTYPDDSVGSVMTAEFIDIKKNMTVLDAINKIRKLASEVEEVYSCYVTDGSRILEGVVTLKQLLINDDDKKVEDIMDTNVIYTSAYSDREAAADLIKKYDLISLPAVDKENRLVGLVTVDDIIDVMEAEATEDIAKMSAVTPTDDEYLKTNVFKLAGNRIVWLVFLMFSSIFSSLIIRGSEAFILSYGFLSVFIPMLTDSCGNAGSQTSSIIIRSMAVGEIKPKDFFKTIWKEIRVALIVSFLLAIFAFVRVILQYPINADPMNIKIATAVSFSLFFSVIIAKMIGCTLPFFAKLIHIDPALMASPIISTIMDALSLLVYFTICKGFLSL